MLIWSLAQKIDRETLVPSLLFRFKGGTIVAVTDLNEPEVFTEFTNNDIGFDPDERSACSFSGATL